MEGLDISRLTFSNTEESTEVQVPAIPTTSAEDDSQKASPIETDDRKVTPIKMKITRNSQGNMQCKLYTKETLRNEVSSKVKDITAAVSNNLIKQEKNTAEISARIKAKHNTSKTPKITMIPAMPTDPHAARKNKSQRTKKTDLDPMLKTAKNQAVKNQSEKGSSFKSVASDHDYCYTSVKPSPDSRVKMENGHSANSVSTLGNKPPQQMKPERKSQTTSSKQKTGSKSKASPSAKLTENVTRLKKQEPSSKSQNMVSVLKKSQKPPLPAKAPVEPPKVKAETMTQTDPEIPRSLVPSVTIKTEPQFVHEELSNLTQVPVKVKLEPQPQPEEPEMMLNSVELLKEPLEAVKVKVEPNVETPIPLKPKALSLQSYYDRKALNRERIVQKTAMHTIYHLSTQTDDPDFCEVGFHTHVLPEDVVRQIRAPKEKNDIGCQTENSYLGKSFPRDIPEKEVRVSEMQTAPAAGTSGATSAKADDGYKGSTQAPVQCNVVNVKMEKPKEESLSCEEAKPTNESKEQNRGEKTELEKGLNCDEAKQEPKQETETANDVATNGRRKRRRYSSCGSESSRSSSRSRSSSSNSSSQVSSTESRSSCSTHRRSRSRMRRSHDKKRRAVDSLSQEYYQRSCDSRSSYYSTASSSSPSVSSPNYKKSSVYSSSSGSRSSSYSPYGYLDQSKYTNDGRYKNGDNPRGHYDDQPNQRYYKRSPDGYMARANSRQFVEEKRAIEDRRVVYVGRLGKNVTKEFLRRKFKDFGTITDITIRFRNHGDSYGFITFKNRQDAYNAIEHGNDDLSYPRYDLSFGGRREFCKVQYADLDAKKVYSEEGKLRNRSEDVDFSTLLRNYAESQKRNSS